MSRVSLRKVLMQTHKPLHQALEQSPFVQRLVTEQMERDEYLAYMHRLGRDLRILETCVATHVASDPFLSVINWDVIWRLQALQSDLGVFESPPPSSDDVNNTVNAIAQCHETHFRALIAGGEPHLLAAHLLLLYFAALFGGQKVARRLKRMFGDSVSTHYYHFENGAARTLRGLFLQTTAMEKKMSDEQYHRFVAELERAWHFHGDLVGVDLRSLLQSNSSPPSESSTSAATVDAETKEAI